MHNLFSLYCIVMLEMELNLNILQLFFLSIYKLIIKNKFHNSEILVSKRVLDENDIFTLVVDHKSLSKEEE